MKFDCGIAHAKKILSITFLCGLTLNAAAATADYGVYDYGDIEEDVGDISFYTAVPEMSELDQKPFAATEVKNLILLIGDGMGFGQVQLARLAAGDPAGKLHMEQMPVTGIMRTHSAESYVTDSAASGTAIACGIKTKNKALGMDASNKKYKSILELAEEKGKRTGLIATAKISHATPAAFVANVKSRYQGEDIAVQILESGAEVLLGGGREHWLPEPRDDDRDLLDEARKKGYAVVSSARELDQASGDRILGLFQDGHLETFAPEPSIVDMTRKAIRVLDKDGESSGFFLMVEGSQIDFAGHAHNEENCAKQTLLFDLAVREAIEFARQDKHTLVVVTADHETGGLVIFGGDLKEEVDPEWSSRGHSAMDVPIYAFGPAADKFTGVMDNTELSAKLADCLGIKKFPLAAAKQ